MRYKTNFSLLSTEGFKQERMRGIALLEVIGKPKPCGFHEPHPQKIEPKHAARGVYEHIQINALKIQKQKEQLHKRQLSLVFSIAKDQ